MTVSTLITHDMVTRSKALQGAIHDVIGEYLEDLVHDGVISPLEAFQVAIAALMVEMMQASRSIGSKDEDILAAFTAGLRDCKKTVM